MQLLQCEKQNTEPPAALPKGPFLKSTEPPCSGPKEAECHLGPCKGSTWLPGEEGPGASPRQRLSPRHKRPLYDHPVLLKN